VQYANFQPCFIANQVDIDIATEPPKRLRYHEPDEDDCGGAMLIAI
jgi:hypothetical protein